MRSSNGEIKLKEALKIIVIASTVSIIIGLICEFVFHLTSQLDLAIIMIAPLVVGIIFYIFGNGIDLNLHTFDFLSPYGSEKKSWGTVYDTYETKTLPFAVIRLWSEKKVVAETISDLDGRYSLIVDPGKYMLQVKLDEYQEYISNITINKNMRMLTLDVHLRSLSTNQSLQHFNVLRSKIWASKLYKYVFFCGVVNSSLITLKYSSNLNIVILMIYFFAILIFFFKYISSPKLDICIKDQLNNPVSGVIVQLLDKNNNVLDVTTTNNAGIFNFALYLNEVHKIRISKSNYVFPVDTTDPNLEYVNRLGYVLNIKKGNFFGKSVVIKIKKSEHNNLKYI